MNVSRYLDRIGYQGSTAPTLETLDRLIEHHQATVPFENLDIVRLHRPIVLERERQFAKIVGERRGGFCLTTATGRGSWHLRSIRRPISVDE